MHRKMLGCCHHVVTIDQVRIALKPFDRCDANAGYEKWILSVGLFGSSPARIACDIEHRRENLSRSARPGLIANRIEDLLHECWIPGRSETQSLWKARAAVLHVSVQCLSRKDHRNSQAGLLQLITLDRVAENCCISREEFEFGSPLCLEGLPRRCIGKRSCGIDYLCSGLPSPAQLLRLLFQSHPGQQVGNPIGNRKVGIFVTRGLCLTVCLFLTARRHTEDTQA